jgi:hypothetical protein
MKLIGGFLDLARISEQRIGARRRDKIAIDSALAEDKSSESPGDPLIAAKGG